MTVLQSSDESHCITLDDMVFEGPYTGGRFSFFFYIPANYPFRAVEVSAMQPIWHPNIDLNSGRVDIPMEWTPVLTLSSCVLAVQVRMGLTLL
jgi:ubiquitin-protein ligase